MDKLLFAALIIFAFLAFNIPNMVNKRRRKKYQAAQQEEADKKDTEERLLQFYAKCREFGISDFVSESSKERAALLAESLSLNMPYTECYAKAEEIIKRREKEKTEARLKIISAQEKEKYKALTKYSELTGRDKSVRILTDLIEMYKSDKEYANKKAWDLLRAGNAYQQKERNWGLAGGAAAALAGGAAGVATAMDIQRENAEIRARNAANEKAYIQYIFPAHQKLISEMSDLQEEIDVLEPKLEKAKLKLVKSSDENEILSNIQISDERVEYSETGAFTIKARASLKNRLIIYDDVPAVADGTIKANLYQNGKCAGSVLMTAPLDGIGTDAADLEGISLNESGKAIKDAPYEVKFEPYHLWEAEA